MSCLDDVRKHSPFPLTPAMLEIADRLCKPGWIHLKVVTLLFEIFVFHNTSNEDTARQRQLSALANSKADDGELLKIANDFDEQQSYRFGAVTWADVMEWLIGIRPISDELYRFLYQQFRNGNLQNHSEFLACVQAFDADPSVSRADITHGH